MTTKPTRDEIIDLMIDLMAELETIEQSAKGMRERVAVISTALHHSGNSISN